MKKKYKLTGCARLVIFLLIFLPIVYIGVSIYHGNNPLEKIENLFSSSDQKEPIISKERFGVKDAEDLKNELDGKNDQIEELKNQIKKLERELEKLKAQSHDH